MLRLAATREVLYGPIILLNLGLFAQTSHSRIGCSTTGKTT